ncbi:kinase-like domain-containing protein [Phlyctochytrium arcticum]|nr:kinase-like domain-containing protein [Phlyctochytrium arcticum]
MADKTSIDGKIGELQKKITIEHTVFEGANKMLRSLTDRSAKEQCEMNALESKRRLDFLEGELRKLHIRKASVSQEHGQAGYAPPIYNSRQSSLESGHEGAGGATPPQRVSSAQNMHSHGSTGRPGAPSPVSSGMTTPTRTDSVHRDSSGMTNFDYMRYGTALTSEKVRYRLREVRHKLEVELKVKAGTENMVKAISGGPTATHDPTVMGELLEKIAEANSKVLFLQKAEHKYAGLCVATEEEEEGYLADVRLRKTGRLRARLIGATNLPGRRSNKDELIAVVRVDGTVKHETKPTRTQWLEYVDLQVDKAQEVEIAVYDRNWTLLGLVWFRLWELDEDLKAKYGAAHETSDVDETWLDMEPAGQLLLRLNFISMGRARTTRDQVFRRNPVQKIFPKNGHKFLPQSFYHVMQCALCNEFLGRQGYQCQNCSYTVHNKCYNRVITKCITKDDIKSGKDSNTGQLLKYKIPHRWENVTNLGASWCTHCGYMVPPGRKMHRCTECSKNSHKECSPMVPCFCGLEPAMADMLVAAFEEHERKTHQKEMEEAEKARRSGLDSASQYSTGTASTGSSVISDVLSTDSTVRAYSEHPPKQEHPVTTSSSHLRPEAMSMPSTPTTPTPFASAAVEVRPLPKIPLEIPPYRGSPLPVPPRPELPLTRPGTVKELRLPPTDITLEDFDFLAVLGRGAFGKVMLASEKKTQQLYAIKALKKEFIIQNDDVKSTKLEKRIFQAASAAHHPYLVNLHSCFQTDTRVYFVMEYVSGGDLMAHIQEKKRFSQARAKFYACEVLLALEYFHRNNIIYRDLKLDNILMSPEGHIKVADYGICKENMPYGQTTRTFCGTPDYMAPEVLMSNRYGRAVDWWSFGVLIYVMLVGRYPFHGEEEQDILDAILNDAVEYPSNIPRDTLSLLQGLMNKNPARRLGGGRLDAEEIKRHPYFAGVDWQAFMEKRVTPPWLPTIRHATDVSNFDPEFTREKAILTPINSILSATEQNEFRDFSYVSEWALHARTLVVR